MESKSSDTKEIENKEGIELAVPESEASNMNGGDHPVTPPLQQQPSSPSAVPLEANPIPDHTVEVNADSNVQVQPDPSLAQQDSPDLVPVPVDQSSPMPAIETQSNVISEPAAISDVQIVTDSKSDSPSSNNHIQEAEEATTDVKIETSSVPPESAKTETSSELPESKTNDDSNPVPTCLNEPEPLMPSPDMKLLEEKVEDDKNGGNTPEKDEKNGGNTPEKDDKNGGNTPEKDDKNGGNTPELPVTPVNGNSKPEPSFCLDDVDFSDGNESGTDDEQSVFTKKLESFFKEKGMDFKPPKFYGEGLNCLKLWRAVMKLGGYDKVTSLKLWRQVGESFRPPKTCTTVSWTFRGFYEKALLDYERQKTGGGELIVPISSHSEPTKVDNQTSGSGRTQRNSAARAMKGWHSRHSRNGEVSDPIIKDKSSISQQKREKQHKSVGLLKRKKPLYFDHAVKASSTKVLKTQVETAVVDIGTPADWVKINVQKTKDCFEVYALVPGLLREEVRVQSDPAGRLVISGEPGHLDNPWGVTPFKKVVSLPARIDSHQTSAVVTLHGQLFVRVPFEQS